MKCLYLWNLLLLYGLYHCRLLSPLHFMVMLHFFKAEIPRCQFSVERYLKKNGIVRWEFRTNHYI